MVIDTDADIWFVFKKADDVGENPGRNVSAEMNVLTDMNCFAGQTSRICGNGD